MVRGFRLPQGGVFLRAGEVWKYGITKNPATRYSQKFLERLGVRYDTMMTGTRAEALAAEKTNIVNYLNGKGVLPPGNKIIR